MKGKVGFGNMRAGTLKRALLVYGKEHVQASLDLGNPERPSIKINLKGKVRTLEMEEMS